MPKTFFIIGGYGGTGRCVARFLLEFTDVNVIVGGLDKKKADLLARELNKKYIGRVRGEYADASRHEILIEAFKNCDLVISATNAPDYIVNVVLAAIEVGADHLDYHFQQNVPDFLDTIKDKILASGRLVITQAGFHPGLPAAFVRYAATQFDIYEKAIVAMAMSAKIDKAESVYELVEEIQCPKSEIYRNGYWQIGNYKDIVEVNLGNFGVQKCFPMGMREIKVLPKMLGVNEVGVYVAGFNWFVDNLVFTLGYLFGKIKKGFGTHFIARLFVWGLNNIKPRAVGVAFALEADGEKNGKKVHCRILATHSDAYDFTAISVVACLKQYLDGVINKSGVWYMGNLVDPEVLVNDLKLMGVSIEKTSG